MGSTCSECKPQQLQIQISNNTQPQGNSQSKQNLSLSILMQMAAHFEISIDHFDLQKIDDYTTSPSTQQEMQNLHPRDIQRFTYYKPIGGRVYYLKQLEFHPDPIRQEIFKEGQRQWAISYHGIYNPDQRLQNRNQTKFNSILNSRLLKSGYRNLYADHRCGNMNHGDKCRIPTSSIYTAPLSQIASDFSTVVKIGQYGWFKIILQVRLNPYYIHVVQNSYCESRGIYYCIENFENQYQLQAIVLIPEQEHQN